MLTSDLKPDISVYYPNVIGKSVPGTATTCGILIEGRDDGKGTASTLALNHLLKHGVRVVSHTGYVSEKYGEFTLVILCDLSTASAPLDDIVIQLRRIKRVSNAQSISLNHQMFDGFLFPLVFMDSYRVVAISSSLMFDLQEKIRIPTEKAALMEAGRTHGREIVQKLREKLESNDDRKQSSSIRSDVLQENITRYMRASGWGKISWADEQTLQKVSIQDPPVPSKESTAAGNLFLQGLICGLAEDLFGRKFAVVEDHYDMLRRLLTIGLAEQSTAIQMEQQKQKITLSPEENSKVLQEIERIADKAERLRNQNDGTNLPEEKTTSQEEVQERITDNVPQRELMVTLPASGGNETAREQSANVTTTPEHPTQSQDGKQVSTPVMEKTAVPTAPSTDDRPAAEKTNMQPQTTGHGLVHAPQTDENTKGAGVVDQTTTANPGSIVENKIPNEVERLPNPAPMSQGNERQEKVVAQVPPTKESTDKIHLTIKRIGDPGPTQQNQENKTAEATDTSMEVTQSSPRLQPNQMRKEIAETKESQRPAMSPPINSQPNEDQASSRRTQKKRRKPIRVQKEEVEDFSPAPFHDESF